MPTSTLKEAKVLVAEHVQVLTGYARRVMLHDGSLSEVEDAERQRRMVELMAMGSCLGLTESEIITLIFKDMLDERRRCGCPTCRSRSADR
jgi:hypothetical protein